jgi:hypothetical protein
MRRWAPFFLQSFVLPPVGLAVNPTSQKGKVKFEEKPLTKIR